MEKKNKQKLSNTLRLNFWLEDDKMSKKTIVSDLTRLCG